MKMSLARILVVDDFYNDLESSARSLERQGFDVVRASGACEALGIFKRDPLSIDGLVLDNNMPETSLERLHEGADFSAVDSSLGRELFDQQNNIRSLVSPYLISGYPSNAGLLLASAVRSKGFFGEIIIQTHYPKDAQLLKDKLGLKVIEKNGNWEFTSQYLRERLQGTNVIPVELNYDETSEAYDSEISLSIPGHTELHNCIKAVMGEKYFGLQPHVVELGIGTGITAEAVLQSAPRSRYRGIDFSKNMMGVAKKRLKDYNVNFVLGDYSLISLGEEEKNDFVVSVIGIHHQESNYAKKKLFYRVGQSLKKGGAFIFGDLVTYRDQREAAFNDALHYHHLVTHMTNERALKEWAYHHKFLNKLAPLEDQVQWLKEVGFRKVDVVYQKFNTALIYAVK